MNANSIPVFLMLFHLFRNNGADGGSESIVR